MTPECQGLHSSSLQILPCPPRGRLLQSYPSSPLWTAVPIFVLVALAAVFAIVAAAAAVAPPAGVVAAPAGGAGLRRPPPRCPSSAPQYIASPLFLVVLPAAAVPVLVPAAAAVVALASAVVAPAASDVPAAVAFVVAAAVVVAVAALPLLFVLHKIRWGKCCYPPTF